jgi:predicted Zn-dependent peptidase
LTSSTAHIETLPNGLTIIAEPIEHLRSAAFVLMVPSGSQDQPEPLQGIASLTCEMVQRGAGSRSSREVMDALDDLGMERTASVTTQHTSFGGALPDQGLYEALAIYADILQRPHLPADQLEDARQTCLHELRALEDEPSHRLMNQLRVAQYGPVLGRAAQGTQTGLERATTKSIQEYHQQHYRPSGAVLSVAGRFDWAMLRDFAWQQFGSWEVGGERAAEPPATGHAGYTHVDAASQQVHIGVSFPGIPLHDPRFIELRGALGILSDGSSSRLFVRIREQRGLCYTVSAACHSLKSVGSVMCYAGTTAERAQETLELMIAELHGLADGLLPGELDRLKVRLQSSLVMDQETSASRASTLAGEWFYLGRVRPLEELQQRVEALTEDRILGFWKQNPPKDLRIVTLGPQPLRPPAI